jgi:GntR family transcriptional regulator
LIAIRPLDPDDRSPLYMQVERSLRDAVCSGDLRSGMAVPPERDLAESLGVSRITVRKALGVLVDEGLLTRRQGAGTFVAASVDRIEKSLSKISSFSEDMASRGLKPSSKWLNKSSGTVTPEEALVFGLSPGEPVYRLSRIRYADGVPMAIEYSTIVAVCLPSIEAVTDSLYVALDQAGARPTRALQRLRAVGLDERRAELLQVEPGTPTLLIERRGFHRNGQPIELTTSYYRGDAYDFLAELHG